MSDDDLIRRGDAREALREVDAWTMPIAHAINSLPAVTVDPAALLADVPRYQTLSGNMLPEDAVLAALSRALIQKGATDDRNQTR